MSISAILTTLDVQGLKSLYNLAIIFIMTKTHTKEIDEGSLEAMHRCSLY